MLQKKDIYYVGETQNLDLRLSQHNTHTFTKGFTKAAEDWEVVLTYQNSSRTTILKLERFIKKMKSRVFIQKLIQNPELIDKLIFDKKL
ncbi:GIY-YIG nuclease family protein [Flavobacterium sp.]|uniref:GIY-YIG nuclease family protein n=1 Tax=Flavobacterium sp. TaxID=239 RepID=UPI0022C3327E|nr:GIY-YIG nuclease family protein [Flavobacterium sp.]MCZ8169159.1 GIY-YIG nuclease family protein [Flavobacterium sp.]MCZ8298127.1 GIY-YIG nuclease family protein [Flavobacterium sp.]